jgi:hypothetical protein
MQPVALGIQMHSGWGILVGITRAGSELRVVERRRVTVVDPHAPGAKQPYHFAEALELSEADKFLAEHAVQTERLAIAVVEEVAAGMRARQQRVVGAGIVLGAGRALPAIAKILASHPLIHTAEGECFREAMRKACRALDLPVIGIRAREVDKDLHKIFGKDTARIQAQIAGAGRVLGPPWTQDHKVAASAALLALEVHESSASSVHAGAG